MSTTITPPAASAEPSVSELRAMLASTAPATTPEPKPEASEPAAEPKEPAAEKTMQAAAEPAETTQPETEEPLPEGVVKRIAKETEKAARIQSEIDKAVSTRKAKEAELAKLKEDGQGSDPVKTPKPSSERPQRPTFDYGEKGHENETWDQFRAREASGLASHEEKLTEWVKSESLREFKAETAQSAAQAKAQERWDGAVEKHGKEFPALMETVRSVASEALQLAISGLDDWSTVAVHLAKNPTQLKELAAAHEANPYRAIATLGRIEASLVSKAKPVATDLPAPLAKVGGNASASGQDLQKTLETGSMSQFRAAMKKHGAKVA